MITSRTSSLCKVQLDCEAYAVVELLQDADVEELVHVDAVLKQEPNKVDPVVVESFKHGVLESPVGPVLTCWISIDLATKSEF